MSEEQGVGYVLDLTTRFHGLNIEKLKSIQQMVPGVKLMYGYTPKVNYIKERQVIDNLAEKLKNEIEFDMKNGIMKVLPSFIGEILITDLND